MSCVRLGASGLVAAVGLLAIAAPETASAQTASAQTMAPPATAQPTAPAGAPDYDPFEKVNRGSFWVNKGVDKVVLRPLALGYKAVLPKPVRSGVRNVINNINEPNTIMNDLLQAKPDRGLKATGRFLINSTVGVAGIFDVAKTVGLERRPADFGQTLGRWGAQPGPYIFVPVLGPTDFRDGFGRIVDSFTGLLNIHDLGATDTDRLIMAAVDGIDTRAELDSSIRDLYRTAPDPYAATRSIYLQNRQSMITESSQAIQQLPSFDEPPAGQPSQPAAPQPPATQTP